jgi:peptide/nickel transport system substrate-binding protein
MRIKKITILFCIIFALAFFLANAQAPKRGGMLRIGIPGGVGTLTPWDSIHTSRNKVLANIFEPLIQNDRKTTKLVPGLALSWEAREGNRVFIMKLRSAVKFHNGATMTADDVLASAGVFPDPISRVEKVDPGTVKFSLDHPSSNFLYTLAQAKFAVAPISSVGEYERLQLGRVLPAFRPLGSGPFKFSRWEKEKEIVLSAFDGYWGGRPYLDQVVYRVIPDDEARIAALERGDIDLVDIIFPKDLERLKRNPDLVVKSVYGLNICFLAMNNKRKPFTEVRVRRAIDLALDKLTLARRFVYGGYGIPTNRPLSPSFFGFPSLPGVGSYNPEEARRLLGEAGYPDGFSARLVVIPFARPYLPDPKGCAEEIKRQLALVGIKVEIVVPRDFTEYQIITSDRADFDLCLTGWISEIGDPDYLLSTILGSPRLGGSPAGKLAQWQNNGFDGKILAARRLPLSDVMGRVKLYNEALAVFREEIPLIPLFHTRVFLVHNRRVKDIVVHPTSIIRFDKVWLAE